MNVYLYLDKDTFLHRLDPRTKIFLLLAAFVLAFIFVNPLYTCAVLVLMFLFAYLAKCLENLRRIWFILVIVAVMTAILWSIFGQGETPLFWFVEQEALLYGISIAFRIDALIVAGIIFLSTTSNEEIAIGLVRLGIPYRFAFAVSTALRLVPTIVGMAVTISQAQRSRGLDLDSGNLFQKVKKHIPLLVPVFISTIRSTHVFSMALESKGFGAEPKRTFYLNPVMTQRDVLALIGFTLLIAATIVLRFAGYGGLEGFTR